MFSILFEYMARACSTSFVNATNFSLLAFFCSFVSRGRIFFIFGGVVKAMDQQAEGGKYYKASEYERCFYFQENKNRGYIPISS